MNKILILVLLLICASQSFSQNANSLKLEFGQGFFEGTHGRVSYQANNVAIGIGYGVLQNLYPYEHGKARSYSVFVNLYFGKVNRFEKRNKYIYADMFRIRYDANTIREFYPLSVGLGKDIYFAKNLGLNFQGGLLAILYNETNYKSDIREHVFWVYPVMPEFAAKFFCRF